MIMRNIVAIVAMTPVLANGGKLRVCDFAE